MEEEGVSEWVGGPSLAAETLVGAYHSAGYGPRFLCERLAFPLHVGDEMSEGTPMERSRIGQG